MEANYNIVLVLPYINMNPPQIYTWIPILNPPPSSLPVSSLWVVSVHQPQASCILPWTWTGDLLLGDLDSCWLLRARDCGKQSQANCSSHIAPPGAWLMALSALHILSLKEIFNEQAEDIYFSLRKHSRGYLFCLSSWIPHNLKTAKHGYREHAPL